MALVFYQPATVTNTLISIAFILVFICRLLVLIYSSKPSLFQVYLPFCILCMESVALSVKFFKAIQDILIYEGFLMLDDWDNN